MDDFRDVAWFVPILWWDRNGNCYVPGRFTSYGWADPMPLAVPGRLTHFVREQHEGFINLQSSGDLGDGDHGCVASVLCLDQFKKEAVQERERVLGICSAIRAHWVKANGEDSISVAAVDKIIEAICSGW